MLERRKSMLHKVKTYIDTHLNPKKNNIHYPDKPDYCKPKTIEAILDDLNIEKADYEWALSISVDSTFQIHSKSAPKAIIINNYFPDGLMA